MKTPTFLIIGGNSWGTGPTLAAAKATFKANYGELGRGYRIVEFDADTTFLGVDMMGYYSWRGNDPVTTTDIAPRKTAREKKR